MIFRFAQPLFLLLLPLVVWVARAGLLRAGTGRVRFSSLATLRKVARRPGVLARYGLVGLRALALVFLLIALARPQGGSVIRQITSEGVDIILTLDTSRSMEERDFRYRDQWVDRLTVARAVVRDFVGKRVNDRLGLVVFGEEAFTQCPLTVDYEILVGTLDETESGMAGDGTNLASAIGVSVARLKDLPSESKVVILLTDGAQTVGTLTPQQAAAVARSFGIRIYTIGVGSEEGAPRQNQGLLGNIFDFAQPRSPLDEATLEEVAEITGGRYFRATNTRKLAEIYDTIDELEKSEIEIDEHTEYTEHYPWPMSLGLLLLGLEMLLAHTRLRKIP